MIVVASILSTSPACDLLQLWRAGLDAVRPPLALCAWGERLVEGLLKSCECSVNT